jgi:hypothetical protein
MSDYAYYDQDIKDVKNQEDIEDVFVIDFTEPSVTLEMHKDDVIHLAKQFGLIVFEAESKL